MALGGKLFFAANDAARGNQLWDINRATGGVTTMSPSEKASGGGEVPQHLTAMGGRLYFSEFDPTNGLRLWSSNGTAAGTVTGANFNTLSGGPLHAPVTIACNTLHGSANDRLHGWYR